MDVKKVDPKALNPMNVGLIKEFRAFLLRGNVVDLAIAVVVGTAFGAVVKATVDNIFTPLIAAVIGTPDFSALSITLNESEIMYGAFINAVVAFVIVSAVIFFFVIKPMNMLIKRNKAQEAAAPPAPVEPTTKLCPACLNTIPLKATRCGHCTSALA